MIDFFFNFILISCRKKEFGIMVKISLIEGMCFVGVDMSWENYF